MIAKKNQQSLAWGVPGLLFQWAGLVGVGVSARAGAGPQSLLLVAAVVVAILGTVCLGAGMCLYAQAKGRSASLGLLGFLGIVGLIVLMCLEDRARETRPGPEDDGSVYAAGPLPRNTPARFSVYFGLFSALPLVGFLTAIVGLVLGIIGLRKSKSLPRRVGRGAAWAGIVLSVGLSAAWVAVVGGSAWLKERERAERWDPNSDTYRVSIYQRERRLDRNARSAEYETAIAELGRAGVGMKSLVSLKAIDSRLALIDRALRCNEALAERLRQSPDAIRRELERAGVSADRALQEAEAAALINASAVLAVLDADHRLWVAGRDFMAILGEQWGHWSADSEGRVRFDASVAQEVIDRYTEADERSNRAVEEWERAKNRAIPPPP